MQEGSTIRGWGIENHGVSIAKPNQKGRGKLVRDLIPSIIKLEGRKFEMHKATKSEYTDRLRQKLEEEVKEYLQSKDLEELADIMEVVYALGILQKISPKRLESIRKRKAKQRGGFAKRIILDSW